MQEKNIFSMPAIVHGLLYFLAMVIPLGWGILENQLYLGGIAAFGSLFALMLDPRRQLMSRAIGITGGGFIILIAAALGVMLKHHSFLMLLCLLAWSWLASIPRPQHAYLSLLGKFSASALLITLFDLPASPELGVLFMAGVLLGGVLSTCEVLITRKISAHNTDPAVEVYALLRGDINNTLYSLTMPITVLLSTLTASFFSFGDPGWVGLTVLFVMHVDDSTAIKRIWQRVAGTAIGVLFSALVLLSTDNPVYIMLIVALMVSLMAQSLKRSYLFFSVVITVAVMLLIDFVMFAQGGDFKLLPWRLIDTITGCLWVLASLLTLRAIRHFTENRTTVAYQCTGKSCAMPQKNDG